MSVIGITGGIATGKTTVCKILSEETSADVFDADRSAARLLDSSPEVHSEVATAFGREVFGDDGRPSRAKLRSIVFSNAEERRKLESILHPRVRAEWLNLAEVARRSGQDLIVDIPLLFETDAAPNFDRIVLTAASRPVQIERIMMHRGRSCCEAEAVIGSQMATADKIPMADHVLWNDGTAEVLEAQVRHLSRVLELGKQEKV